MTLLRRFPPRWGPDQRCPERARRLRPTSNSPVRTARTSRAPTVHHRGLPVGRSPASNKSGSSASSTFRHVRRRDVKHQQLDYVGGGLLALHYYPHLGSVASSAGFSPSSSSGIIISRQLPTSRTPCLHVDQRLLPFQRLQGRRRSLADPHQVLFQFRLVISCSNLFFILTLYSAKVPHRII